MRELEISMDTRRWKGGAGVMAVEIGSQLLGWQDAVTMHPLFGHRHGMDVGFAVWSAESTDLRNSYWSA